MSGVPPRLLTPIVRRSRAVQAGVLAALLIGAAFANPDHPLPVDLCAFKYLTGLPCPACGLTRALCHVMRGDWAQSLHYHPAGILLAAALTGWALWLGAESAQGRPLAEAVRVQLGSALVRAGAGLSVIFWIFRLALPV
jgi:hypothetical protein